MINSKGKKYFVKQRRAGVLFILPSMLIFIIFVFVPLIMSFIYSTQTFNMMFNNVKFVGASNYIKLICDSRFWNALKNTVFYTVCIVPLQVILALFAGIALKKQSRFTAFVRSIYFLPAIVSMTIIAITWSFLINNDYGIYMYFFRRIGINIPNLLNSTTWAMPTMIVIGIWKNLGFKMIIIIAGLEGISDTYYEVAILDGAGKMDKFRYITVPMLMPTLTFVVVDSVISSFQVFDQVYVVTKGGPLFTTETLVQYVYSNAFEKSNMGYASAIAVSLLMITLLSSIPLFKIMKKNENELS
ncbi:MAG: sugar ABC transporter permease [Lachnoanaerobaculum sp.]|jgi:hypothetical protein|uniref:carbohydrate ABC transporter permease n=1 Tax=Lachnoanaerobaculum sp. TaxID=2049030 RepID=UPI0025BDEA2D|nr:sugar ABC transporter permease [Lachnoanaerobaculum sp.]MBS5882997.1 sugar ABC transporter permease [Lachnoanaerobaculum sp.]